MSIEQFQPRAEVALASSQDQAIMRLADWAQSAQAAHQIATTLVQTSFCPDAFRNKPGEATAAILAGVEVGLQPMAALRSFDIISGQAAPRAITLRAIVQSQGHEIELVESTATRCKMRGRRRGSADWQGVTWTIERARDLGVLGKSNWKSQPQAMLVARATSEIARLIASDAILGLPYSAEEIADGGSYDQAVSEMTATPSAPSGTRKMSRPVAATVTTPETPDARPSSAEGDPEAGPDEVASSPASGESPADDQGISSAQLKKLGALMREAGITERADALTYVGDVIGRPVDSRNDLTKHEASQVIDSLQADLDTPFPTEAES